MTTIETKPRFAENEGARPAVEIRFYFVDGSQQTFFQNDPEVAEAIKNQIHPSILFHQSRILVADDYSKSVFVCSHINRVDFVFKEPDFFNLPPDHADVVELTEAEYRKRVPVNEPDRLERREQRREVGDMLVSFLDLRMRGGCHIYLMNETLVKIPADSQSFMQRLLSKEAYIIRLPRGGHGVINLQNLIGYTVYPGVPEVPADAWLAKPRNDL